MPLDPSIILQAGKGVTKLLTPDEIQEQQMTRELGGMKLAQARQGVADDAAYRQVLQSGATGSDQITALQKAGLGKQAMETAKFQTEQQKSVAERGKGMADAMKQGAGLILANPTEENAIRTLTELQQNYGMNAQQVDAAKARIYAARNDPNTLKQLAVGWGADADKVLGQFKTENLGGTMQTQRTNPVTGQVEVANTQARTQSPDSLAGQAVTMRGQDMANQRAQEANALRAQGNAAGKVPSGYRLAADGTSLEFIPGGPADPNTKPAGGKPLNDTQAKALQFGTRMQAAGDIFDKLASQGVNASVPGARAGYGIGSVISALQPAERQQLDQAKRDFINAVLRRESGAAIAPSEFDSAEKQYFPQPGDSEAVIAQKKANRELSTRGILEEVPDSAARVSKIRGATANPGGATGSFDAPKGEQPKTKPINIGGQDFMAERAPDGKYYVQKNGKWFEVR